MLTGGADGHFSLPCHACIYFPLYLIDGSITADISNSLKESEMFTGDTSKDNHSPGPVIREASP